MRDFRLLCPAVALWISALVVFAAQSNSAPSDKSAAQETGADLLGGSLPGVGFSQAFGEILLPICAAGVAALLIFCAVNRRNLPRAFTSQALFCSLLIAIQFASIAAQSAALFPANLVGAKTAGQVVKIASVPSISDSFGRVRCSYQAEGFAPHIFLTLQTLSDPDCALEYGGEYIAAGKYSADDFHAKNVATLQADSFEIYQPPSVFDQFCNRIRANFLEIAEQLPGHSAGLVPGMSVGDTRFMDSDFKDRTKVAGLAHLTAISGAHFVIIISLIGGILLALRLSPKKRAILQIASVFALVVLVHPTDSVKRAAVMSLIGLLGVFLNRRSQSIAALGFAVSTWLIFDPWLAKSFGFALSCAATAGIILFTPAVATWLSRYLGQTLGSLFAVPVVAQICCYPILLLMSDYIALYSPFSNVLVIPAVEPATLLSLLTCILASISPPLALFAGKIAGVFTEYIAQVAIFVTNIPGSSVPWIPGVLGALLLYAIIASIAGSPQIYRKIYTLATGLAPREATSNFERFHAKRAILVQKVIKTLRKRTALVVAVVFCITALGAAVFFGAQKLHFFPSAIPENWVVAACDVGQGDSAVVRTGANSGVLVDAGPPNRETGGENVSQCLEKLQVDRLDAVVISHFHDDHVGGIQDALKAVPVGKIIADPFHSPARNFASAQKLAEQYSVPLVDGKEGDSEQFGCGQGEPFCTKYTIYSTYSGKGKTADNEENDSSLAMLFEVNGATYWTAGDLEEAGSKAALAKLRAAGVGNVDAAKVNHHGSATQVPALIEQLRPLAAIFPVGKNTYGHPTEKTIKLYTDAGAQILRTDLNAICGLQILPGGEVGVFSER